MPFKKLNSVLLEKIAALGLEEPTALQKTLIPKIKSGANIFAIGDEGSGKTEALVISVLQRLQMKSKGDNPVALIFVKDNKAILELEERFKRYTQWENLRIRLVNEDRIINHQKDEIYLGADIVIATTKRLSKLYFLNGINLNELEMIAIEDAEFLVGTDFHTDINRISQSIKCQHVVFAKKYTSKLTKLEDLFMVNPQIVEAK